MQAALLRNYEEEEATANDTGSSRQDDMLAVLAARFAWLDGQLRDERHPGPHHVPGFLGPPCEYCFESLPEGRARSHCRFVRPQILFIPDSLRYSVPLFLKRQCDRTLPEGREATITVEAVVASWYKVKFTGLTQNSQVDQFD